MGKQARLTAVENQDRPSIEITNEFLSNNTVFMAMQQLLKGFYGSETAFQLEKLSRRLAAAHKKFAFATEALIKKYAECDDLGVPKRLMAPKILSNGQMEMKPVKEDGKVKLDVNGAPLMEPVMIPTDFIWKNITEKNDQGEEIVSKGDDLCAIEAEKLGEEVHKLDVYKLRRLDFIEAKLTVAQWMSLNPLLVDPYVIDEEPSLQ